MKLEKHNEKRRFWDLCFVIEHFILGVHKNLSFPLLYNFVFADISHCEGGRGRERGRRRRRRSYNLQFLRDLGTVTATSMFLYLYVQSNRKYKVQTNKMRIFFLKFFKFSSAHKFNGDFPFSFPNKSVIWVPFFWFFFFLFCVLGDGHLNSETCMCFVFISCHEVIYHQILSLNYEFTSSMRLFISSD